MREEERAERSSPVPNLSLVQSLSSHESFAVEMHKHTRAFMQWRTIPWHAAGSSTATASHTASQHKVSVRRPAMSACFLPSPEAQNDHHALPYHVFIHLSIFVFVNVIINMRGAVEA